MAASALDFVPTGTNAETLPANFTERRFRHFREQTDVGLFLRLLGSTRLWMPAPRSVEIVTQSASGSFSRCSKCGDMPFRPTLWARTLPWHSGTTHEAPFLAGVLPSQA